MNCWCALTKSTVYIEISTSPWIKLLKKWKPETSSLMKIHKCWNSGRGGTIQMSEYTAWTSIFKDIHIIISKTFFSDLERQTTTSVKNAQKHSTSVLAFPRTTCSQRHSTMLSHAWSEYRIIYTWEHITYPQYFTKCLYQILWLSGACSLVRVQLTFGSL